MNTYWRWSVVVVAAAGLTGLLVFGPKANTVWPWVQEHLATWQTAVAVQPIVWGGAFVLTYATVTGLSLPLAVVFSLMAGALFGRWWGTMLAVTGATLGGCGAFLACRYLFRDWVRSHFAERFGPIDAGVRRDGAYYLLSLRLVPAVPFFVINLAMGLTPMRLRTFAVVSWFGMLPGGFVFVNLGTEASRIENLSGLVSPGVLLALALLGVVPWLVRAIRTKFQVSTVSEVPRSETPYRRETSET